MNNMDRANETIRLIEMRKMSRKYLSLLCVISMCNFSSCGNDSNDADLGHETSKTREHEANSKGQQKQERKSEGKPHCGHCQSADDNFRLTDKTRKTRENEVNLKGQQKQESKSDEKPPLENEQSLPIHEKIMEDELIWDDTEVIELYPDSFLYFEISVDSDLSAVNEILYHIFSLRSEEAAIKYGQCFYPHRPKFEDENKFILDYMKRLRLKLKIGERIYPLGEVMERDGHTLKTILPITKQMLEGSHRNEANFIIDDSETKEFRRNFEKFDECDGLERTNYQTDLKDLIFFETLKKSKEFMVNASIQYYKKVKRYFAQEKSVSLQR